MFGSTDPLGMRRQCPSGAAIYGNAVNQSAGPAETGRPKASNSPQRIDGVGSMVPRGSAYGEAEQGAHPPTRKGPPSPGWRCSAPKNTLPATRKKGSRHSRPGAHSLRSVDPPKLPEYTPSIIKTG